MANNPAARLYELARRARTVGGEIPARLWASVFELPYTHDRANPEELVEIVKALMALEDLIDETEAGIQDLKFDDFYLEAFPPLRQVVFSSLASLRGSVNGLMSPLTLEYVTLLRVMGSEWNKKRPEPEVDEQVLKEIQAEAHELFEEIKAAEIDSELKRLILSLSAEIEDAIKQYRIGGPERLKDTLAFIQAKVNLNSGIVAQAEADKSSNVWWNRLYNLGVKLYGAIKFANDTRKTIERSVPFLRLLGPTDDIPPSSGE